MAMVRRGVRLACLHEKKGRERNEEKTHEICRKSPSRSVLIRTLHTSPCAVARMRHGQCARAAEMACVITLTGT